MLPLFYDKAASTAMIKHGMHIQKMITEHLNAGQVPVMTFDQPLFALAICVQWKWPDITILTASSKNWEQINHKHCHFFIHFQVVTPHRNSMERGKNQYGMHGRLIPV